MMTLFRPDERTSISISKLVEVELEKSYQSHVPTGLKFGRKNNVTFLALFVFFCSMILNVSFSGFIVPSNFRLILIFLFNAVFLYFLIVSSTKSTSLDKTITYLLLTYFIANTLEHLILCIYYYAQSDELKQQISGVYEQEGTLKSVSLGIHYTNLCLFTVEITSLVLALIVVSFKLILTISLYDDEIQEAKEKFIGKNKEKIRAAIITMIGKKFAGKLIKVIKIDKRPFIKKRINVIKIAISLMKFLWADSKYHKRIDKKELLKKLMEITRMEHRLAKRFRAQQKRKIFKKLIKILGMNKELVKKKNK